MSAQETSAELRLSPQLTSLQEMSAQETAASAESPQETSPQDTASQETFAFAVSDQLTASKTGPLPPAGSAARNCSSALFGFGALAAITDLTAFTSPSPSEPGTAEGVGRAVAISAPLIWSGPQLGLRAMICAAIPATIGAANDVPESWMYPGETTLLAFWDASVEAIGIGPTM